MPQEAPINYTFPEKQQHFLLAKGKRDVKVKQREKVFFLTVAGFADTGDNESRTVGSVLRLRSLVACIDRLSLSRSRSAVMTSHEFSRKWSWSLWPQPLALVVAFSPDLNLVSLPEPLDPPQPSCSGSCFVAGNCCPCCMWLPSSITGRKVSGLLKYKRNIQSLSWLAACHWGFNLHLSNALCKYLVPVPPHIYFNVCGVSLTCVPLCWWVDLNEALGLPGLLEFLLIFLRLEQQDFPCQDLLCSQCQSWTNGPEGVGHFQCVCLSGHAILGARWRKTWVTKTRC